jgi:hypothetical protein
MKDIGRFTASNQGTHNPKDMMQKVLSSELQGRKFRFIGSKNTEKPMLQNTKQKSKSENKTGGKKGVESEKGARPLFHMMEKHEDQRTTQFRDYRDKLADPRFYTPIKSQLSNAANNANAARTGGPIMIDKYMIPGDLAEFKWLNQNMDTVT